MLTSSGIQPREDIMHISYPANIGRLCGLALASALLAACGGGSSGGGGGGGAAALSGTAAVGAPLVGATISLKCNGQSATATTSAQGKWSASIRQDALPCAIEVSGGTVNGAPFAGKFYSYAQSLGTINVTPLTSLALARAVQSTHGKTPEYWFSHVKVGGDAPAGAVCVFTDTSTVQGQSVVLNTCMLDVPQSSCNGPEDITNPGTGIPVKRSYSFKTCPQGATTVGTGTGGGSTGDSYDPKALAAAVATARTALLQALRDSGYTVPAGLDPFTTAFDPVSGNAYDDLLEALREALGSDPDYATLESDFAANGSTLPEAPAEPSGGGNDTIPGTVNSALVKSYTLTFNKGSGAGCGSSCSYTDGQQVTAVVGGDNSLTIGGKKLTNPFNRKFGGTPHLPELIWKDGDLEYALTDNQSGTFNEINVGKAKAGGGIPGFIGQLRAPVVAEDPVAKLAPFAGSYAPLYVEKSGNYTMTGNPAANAPITVSISAAGVVTVNGEAFDPADSKVKFNDFNKANQSEPRYTLTRTDDATNQMSVDIHIVDGAIVSWKLSKITLGNGFSSTSYVRLEERPLPATQLTLIDAFKNMGKLTLTALKDGNGLYAKCDALWLTVSGDGTLSTPWQFYLEKAPAGGTGQGSWVNRESFWRSYGRLITADGNETLAFRLSQLVKRADGKVDVKEVTNAITGTFATFASSDPTQISAAGCPAR